MMSGSTLAGNPPMRAVSLSDRFALRSGTILISGVQALVRLMIVQAERDKAAGLETGGFVSGYRGSPLGTLDTAFASAAKMVAERGIVVRPAVNEELGATAVAGTQQIAQTPDAKVQGVFALWYGKGPGVERASDAIRHGNVQGSSPHGGVVLAVGDDHLAKSSSIVCYTDDIVAGLRVPLFYPADAEEIIAYGLHGFAMSRHTGSWAALKILTDVADSTRAIDASEQMVAPVLPEIKAPPAGLHNNWPETTLEQETRQIDYRLPAVLEYIRANRLDRTFHKSASSTIGIVTAGKSWLDLQEGLRLLGLDEARLVTLGVALYKPAVIWPLEPEGVIAFADGLESVIVLEEKDEFVERQIKSILYGRSNAPRVLGKARSDGTPMFPATGDITPERVAAELGDVIAKLTNDNALADAARDAGGVLSEQHRFVTPPISRKPFFCSGCPHNRSTVVPEGSRATAGIGCHGLAALFRPATSSWAQMGGEGVHWVGLSHFTNEPHMFANMGDGTYFHSGLLAIRQAVAADVNITYKILYNSAVAMTGGQSVDGELTVEQLVDQLRAENVKTVVISADDLGRYPGNHPVRKKVDSIGHRDDLDALQHELRKQDGVSVIIYDQMCATEMRRLRKRGKLADPTRRVFVNELVCEGCGDCSVKSNCLSVEPVETEFGVKRRINQSSCNKDFSCLDGFCPSFVTVEGGKPKRSSIQSGGPAHDRLPAPALPDRAHERILVAGVGGTGVVTIGALLSMSAHMQHRRTAVLDQVGLAQKGGAVMSHIHVADDPITALRIPPGQADVVIVCDQIVGNMRDVMAAITPERTHVLANADTSITGDFTTNRDAAPDATLLARRLSQRAGAGHFTAHPFTKLSERLLGDGIGSNLMMIGYAWQRGWLTVDKAVFDAAVELNGTAVTLNQDAFAWGRQLAVDAASVYTAAGLTDAPVVTLDELIEKRADFLQCYQDRAYSGRFREVVARVRAAEQRVGTGDALTTVAVKALFKLMSYKDEYEVARLYTDGSFAQALQAAFEGDVKLSFHLAPAVLGRRDKITGHQRKSRFGPWMIPMFRLLARGRKLRGTTFDPFGRTAERRMERRMIGDYERLLDQLITGLSPDNLGLATKIAGLALEVRGFGHVKERAIGSYYDALAKQLPAYVAGQSEIARARVSPVALPAA